jgi:hypothetical protein
MGLNQRMARRVKMLCRMLIFGTVTAPNVAADQAETQVNPGITCFQTVFAPIGRWSNFLYLVQMRTLFRHRFFLSHQKRTASALEESLPV